MSKKDLRNIFCLFGVILIGCTSNIIPDPVTKLATKNEIIKGNYIADVDEFTTYEIKKVNHLPEPIDGGYINVRTLDLSNVHLSKTEWNNKKEQLFLVIRLFGQMTYHLILGQKKLLNNIRVQH